MSIDWGDIEPESKVATKAQPKSSIDWGDIEPESKPKRKRGQYSGRGFGPPKGESTFERLGQAAEKKPEFLVSQTPPAILEAAGRYVDQPKNIANLMSRLFGEDWGTPEFRPRTASKPPEFGDWRDKLPIQQGKGLFDTLGEKYRESLPDDQKELAKRTAEAEADLLQFLPWGVLGKKLPLKGPQALAEAETWSPKGIKGPSAESPIRQLLEGRPEKVPATMESGLPKLRAMEAKNPQWATITPAKQTALIEGLNKDASALVTKAVSKAHPIIEDINAGKDLDAEFRKGFRGIKNAAQKFNPEINTTPLARLYSEKSREYRDIPSPHPQAAKIMREIDAFRKNPQSGLFPLLKIYRSNNQKMADIYETRYLTGKQAEFVDFLNATNKAISQSFQGTLPDGSPWVKQFLDYNAKFGDYLDSLKTQSYLRPLIGGDLTPENVGKFLKIGFDPKKQAKLKYSMGDEGGAEIIQIAKDLRRAIETVKKMKAKEIKAWDATFPLPYLIPGIGKVAGTLSTLKKGYDYSKRAYGWWLSQPATREALDEALKSVADHNLENYESATDKLKTDL